MILTVERNVEEETASVGRRRGGHEEKCGGGLEICRTDSHGRKRGVDATKEVEVRAQTTVDMKCLSRIVCRLNTQRQRQVLHATLPWTKKV
jgi:hypothetical protein